MKLLTIKFNANLRRLPNKRTLEVSKVSPRNRFDEQEKYLLFFFNNFLFNRYLLPLVKVNTDLPSTSHTHSEGVPVPTSREGKSLQIFRPFSLRETTTTSLTTLNIERDVPLRNQNTSNAHSHPCWKKQTKYFNVTSVQITTEGLLGKESFKL